MAVPDFIQMIHVTSGGDHDSDVVLTTSLRVMWAVSYLLDAVIYIWMKTSVRRLLKKKLGFHHNRVHVWGWDGVTSSSAHVTTVTRLASESIM